MAGSGARQIRADKGIIKPDGSEFPRFPKIQSRPVFVFVMNQMGHQFPNMIGVKGGDLDEKVQQLLPAYMTMGDTGMAHMPAMGMPMPPNSIPMIGGQGPHDYITMGGMFTILKVREGISSYGDPGWFQKPPGTLADLATASNLRRDGIDPNQAPPVEPGPIAPATSGNYVGPITQSPASQPATMYTCVMHPQVISDKPGKCPICGMRLVKKVGGE